MAWTERYLNLGATNNGDGTAGNDAASGGAVGAWNSWANAVTGLGTVAAATRVNVKGSATLSADITSNPSSTAINEVVWWRGYNTTIGDCDTDWTLARPTITMNTGFRFSVSGGYQIFQNLVVAGNYEHAGLFNITVGPIRMTRVKVTNTFNATTAYAVRQASGECLIVKLCHVVAHASANGALRVEAANVIAHGNYLGGGVASIYADLGGNGGLLVATHNVMDDPATYGIYLAGTAFLRAFVAIGNSIYSPGADGIRFSNATPTIAPTLIANNIFSACGGYGIKNTDASAFGMGAVDSNLFHSVTSGQTNGLIDDGSTGDGSARATQTDASSPFEDAGNDDFTPKSTSNAIANATPLEFDTP